MKRQLLEQLRADQCTTMIDGDDWKRYEPQQLPPERDALLLLQDPPASIAFLVFLDMKENSRLIKTIYFGPNFNRCYYLRSVK
ncbi:hypothetical protein ACH6EH_11405 [Paenibacillus sp. JSM ZJ436]|uniref:hypothetical protein n=1 Tax=Paenibacillus sp. JSM ZJ436 TaxID=3376190 RepID=UPI0037A430BD